MQSRNQTAERSFKKAINTYDPSKYVRGNKLVDPNNINYTQSNINQIHNQAPNNSKNNSNNQLKVDNTAFTYDDYIKSKQSSSNTLNSKQSFNYVNPQMTSNTFNNQQSFNPQNSHVNPINPSDDGKFSYEQYKGKSSQNIGTERKDTGFSNNFYPGQNNNNEVIYNAFIHQGNNPSTSSLNNNEEFNPLNFNINHSAKSSTQSLNSNNTFGNYNPYGQGQGQQTVTGYGYGTPTEDIKKTLIVSQSQTADQAQDTFNPYESISLDHTKPVNPMSHTTNFAPYPNSGFPSNNNSSMFPNLSDLNINKNNSQFNKGFHK